MCYFYRHLTFEAQNEKSLVLAEWCTVVRLMIKLGLEDITFLFFYNVYNQCSKMFLFVAYTRRHDSLSYMITPTPAIARPAGLDETIKSPQSCVLYVIWALIGHRIVIK